MTEGEPTVRDATLDDAPAILELIQAAYDRWPPYEVSVTPLEHLRWKMNPPRETPLHHALVFVGDRPAATQLRWPHVSRSLAESTRPMTAPISLFTQTSADADSRA